MRMYRCICGRPCKGLSGFQTHGRACELERARSAAFIEAIEAHRKPPTDAEFLAAHNKRGTK